MMLMVVFFLMMAGPAIVVTFMPVCMAMFSGIYVLVALGQLGQAKPDVPLRDLHRLLITVNIVIPFFYAALMAAVSAPLWLVLYLFTQIPKELPAPSGALSFLIMGACGLLLPAAWTFRDFHWRYVHLRRLRNLPTSKTRSAALGLAEFAGTARSMDGTPVIGRLDARGGWVRPFYLEDDSGRIAVDPSDAIVRGGFQAVERFRRMWQRLETTHWVQLMSGRLCEAVLQRKPGNVYEFRDGDPVYVLGSVELNPDAAPGALDADRLVVRRSRQAVRPPWWTKLLWGEGAKQRVGFDDIFYLTDRGEADALKAIRDGGSGLLLLTVPWMALAGVMLWLGASIAR